MDELARQKFTRISGKIAEVLVAYEEAERELNAAAHQLYVRLGIYLEEYERVHGETEATKRLCEEIATTWKIFSDPATLPAIEAVRIHFDDMAATLRDMVRALP